MTPRPAPPAGQRGSVLAWLLVLLLLALLGGTLYLVRVPLLRGFAQWWIVDEKLEKAQAIVVLGGDNPRGERLRHAVQLYRSGWAPRLILSGAPFRSYFSEVVLMKREATALGVPAEDLILAAEGARSTLEEALELRRVLKRHNFRKIIVVTSNYHTRRARDIFRSLYRREGTQVFLSAAPDSDFNPQSWWQERQGLKLLWLEWQKLVYTWWELRHPPKPLTTFLLSLWTPSAL